MPEYHLAQINIGRMLAPVDSEVMFGFTSRLDEINALADEAEGFVWRLQTDDGDATAIRPYDDDMMIINMSVWESFEALHTYTYKTLHAELIKGRKQWFEKLSKPHMVLWWIPAGHIPTIEEALAKLDLLEANGSTPEAFTFAKRFTAEDWQAIEKA